MMPELYERVALRRDVNEHSLKKGDVALLIDRVPHPSGGESGVVLEVFNAVGESLSVVAVKESEIEALRRRGSDGPLARSRWLTKRFRHVRQSRRFLSASNATSAPTSAATQMHAVWPMISSSGPGVPRPSTKPAGGRPSASCCRPRFTSIAPRSRHSTRCCASMALRPHLPGNARRSQPDQVAPPFRQGFVPVVPRFRDRPAPGLRRSAASSIPGALPRAVLLMPRSGQEANGAFYVLAPNGADTCQPGATPQDLQRYQERCPVRAEHRQFRHLPGAAGAPARSIALTTLPAKTRQSCITRRRSWRAITRCTPSSPG